LLTIDYSIYCNLQLFELQERHKALGCTLIVTQNHLITLREDFSAPLRPINQQVNLPSAAPEPKQMLRDDDMLCIFETSSLVSFLSVQSKL